MAVLGFGLNFMVAGTFPRPFDMAIRWATTTPYAPSAIPKESSSPEGSFIMKRLIGPMSIGPILILAAAAAPAWPRVAVVFRLASPPLPVQAGQEFTLCAANVGTANADIVLNFVSVRTGAIIASKQVMLPPPGATPSGMPD